MITLYAQAYLPFDPQLDKLSGLPDQYIDQTSNTSFDVGRVTFADGTMKPGKNFDSPRFYQMLANRDIQSGKVILKGKDWKKISADSPEPWVTWAKEDAQAKRLFRPFVFYDVMGVTEFTFQRLFYEDPGYFPILELMQGALKVEPTEKKPFKPIGNVFFEDLDVEEETDKQAEQRYKGYFKGSFVHPTAQNVDKNYLATFPGQRALLNSMFEQPTVKELRDSLDTEIPFYENSIGSFTLIDGYALAQQEDPMNALKQTDVRFIQENNPGALVQLASNFNCLEGGMGKKSEMLEHMQYMAVQGENAALSTMGASIVRKYILQPLNLLQDLQGSVVVDESGRITWVTPKKLNNNDADKVRIGLHHNVMVTSGYYTPYSKKLTGNADINDKVISNLYKIDTRADRAIRQGKTTYKIFDSSGKLALIGDYKVSRKEYLYDNAFVKQGRDPLLVFNGAVDKTNEIRIHQAITAALDVNARHQNSVNDPDSAKVLLKAAYEGTLFAAARLLVTQEKSFMQSKKVFLTLVGTGSFKNELSWVMDVLKDPAIIKTIAYFGLDVYLVLYYNIDDPMDKKSPQDYKLITDTVATIDKNIKLYHKKLKSDEKPIEEEKPSIADVVDKLNLALKSITPQTQKIKTVFDFDYE